MKKVTLIETSIISFIFIVSLILIICMKFCSYNADNLNANIYYKGNLVQSYKLIEDYSVTEQVKDIDVTLIIDIKDCSIAIIESDCPGQNCIHFGYISKPYESIICAHNYVYILIEESSSTYDWVIG